MRVAPTLGTSVSLFAVVGAACGGPGLDRSVVEGSPVEDFPLEQVPTRGHVITVSVRGEPRLEGELIALDPDVLWLENEWGNLRAIPRSQIEYVEVELYESDAAALATWTTLGTISTISHGFFIFLTGTAWLSSGIPASVSESERNDVLAVRHGLEPLFQFARFPQGMPHALRAAIQPDWRPPAMETAPRPEPPPGEATDESGRGLSAPIPAP